MKRGWLRAIAAASSVVLVAGVSPDLASAEGNAGLHIHKFVDPQQLTITPGISVTLVVDKTSAIPGDTLTYTSVVTNPTVTFGMGGSINAEAIASADATVAYYWDELEVCGQGCGNAAADPHWTPVATFEAVQAGYLPVTQPALHTGMVFTAQAVNRPGITYPTKGDPILGTLMNPRATATWTYLSKVALTPAQVAVLSDPAQVTAIRNVLHLEVTVRNSSAAQPYTDPEQFSNPFTTAPNPGAIQNITVTFKLPDGSTSTVGPAQVPALGTLSPGGSASATTHFKVAVPAPRGSSENERRYIARLGGLDGSALTATAVASGTGFSGNVSATSPPATTIENIPIVLITKAGPAEINAGDTETNPLTLINDGGAPASSLAVVDAVPGGTNGTASGVPGSLAPGMSASAVAKFPVPISQAEGDLIDTASVTWKDANGNSYGPLTSSFTTRVHNRLFSATLTLAPANSGPNPPGTSQKLIATLLDRNGTPIPNQLVNFSITGANPGSGTATTNASGIAEFTYTGINSGIDVAQATVTAPGLTLTSNTASISWGKPLQPIVTSQVQGNFFPNPNNSCAFGATPSSTPAFGQTFPDILFNPPPSAVPHDISTVNQSTRPFTDLTVDVNGNYNGQIVAQGNGVQAGNGSLSNLFAVFTGNFIANQAGDVTFTILHDDGYILGVGNGATRVNGDLEGNPPLTTPFQGYGVVAAWNQAAGSQPGTATVHFPAPGAYPYELDYTECGGGPLFLVLETAQFIAQTDPLSIYVGYADGLRPGGSAFPFPWQGSPGVTFVGGCTFDAGALRFDNSGATDITFDKVTVDLPGAAHFDLWPANLVVPAHGILILTQTGCFNFDTSDFSNAGCGGNNNVLPLVNVTRAGVTTTYTDTHQILNTRGFDLACQGNESTPWQRIAGQANTINIPLPPSASLDISPFKVAGALLGQNQALTVSAMDAAGNAVANLPVTLQVFGPNAQTLTSTTLASGLAVFGYVGRAAGTDSIQASAFIGGLRAISNLGSVTWSAPAGGGPNPSPNPDPNAPPPPSITTPTPADGTVVTKPVSVTASIAPPSGQSITSWRVFYQAASGGPQVVIGSGAGAPPSPLSVTFDPTLLTNGGYTMTIEATADNGAVQDVSSGISVVGGLKLGRYTTTYLDQSVGVAGLQMQVQRTYDSTDKSTGDFGIGWHVDLSNVRVSSNHMLGGGGWTMYNSSCTLGLCFTAYKNSAPRYVTITYLNGRTEIFDFQPAGGTNLFWDCAPTFTARAATGGTSTLVALDDTTCSYNGDGNIYGASGAYSPHRFKLTTRTRQVLVLDTKLGLLSMTDRNGNSITIDAAGVHGSNGQSITYTRDSSGRITEVTGPGGQSTSYSYSSAGDLATSTDVLGGVNTYTYNASHNLLNVSGPTGAHSSATYDSAGRLKAITDALGHTTQIQNNVGAQTVTYIDPSGANVTVATADDLGNIVRQDTSAGGQTYTTLFTYDAAGHVTHKTDPLGRSVSTAYDAQGDLTRYTDALGNVTQISYDANGLPTSIVGPDGSAVASATYDANGNAITLMTPGGGVTDFTYDSAGRIVSRTDAAGRVSGFSFDASGRLTTMTDGAGKPTNLGYDAANRVTSMTDPMGSLTRLSYDAAGNVVAIVDGKGNAEAIVYDALSRVISATDELGRTVSLTYDVRGDMTSVTERTGGTARYTYDSDNHLSRIDYPGGEFVAYTYDGFGRPVTIANGSATISNTYDAVGQLVKTTTQASPFGSVTLNYAYDAAGNKLSSTGPDGTVNYAYDSQGRLTKVTDPKGGVFGLHYDAASHVVGLTRPNGVNDVFAYDRSGKLTGVTSTLGSTTLQALTQTLDANSQVASRSDAAGTATFNHDLDGRLVGVSGPGSASQAYAYDANGNMTSGPLSPTSTYDAGNELTSDANFNYTYDSEGRRVSKVDRVSGATTRYVYNGRGQLTSIQYPDGTSDTYKYDPFGRRLGVTTGATTKAYAYDGINTRLEFNGSGAQTASYVGTEAPDQVLEQTRGTSTYYYLDGFQRSVSALTDSSGAVAASYRYDAFGRPSGSATSITNPFTYTGREFDSKSGLYYNRARYYDPNSGAFISQDPLGGGGRNPYSYAADDPVDYSDPGGAVNLFGEAGLISRAIAWARGPGRLLGCGLAILATAAEVWINIANKTPATADWVAMLIGVASGCILGMLGAHATKLTVLLKIPIIALLVATFADLIIQGVCSLNSRGDFGKVDPLHAVWVGMGAATIALGGGIIGEILAPDAAPLLQRVVAGVGIAVLSGDAAGILDLIISGGACGP